MSKVKLILVSVLMISLFFPHRVQATQAKHAPSRYSISDTIAGYKTLAVFTSEDTMCMKAGYKRLVLQTTEQNIEAYLPDSRPREIKVALQQELSITTSPSQAAKDIAYWNVEVVGPQITLESVLAENQKWNEDAQINGCPKLFPLLTSTDWAEIKSTTHPSPGYAEFEDRNAGTYTNDNAQSVNIVAPSIPNSNARFSLLNNVRPDSSTFYLLQNGLVVWGSSGHVNWTDTSQGYVAQYYSMPYISGHSYFTVITYTSGAWQMCARDNSNPATYTCIIETNGVGTTLRASTNTAVWMENYITDNPSWYEGWPTRFRVYGAKIYRNGVAQNWSTNHRHTIDACSTNYPATSALSGTLANGGNGYFLLAGMPLDC